jgi:hypothetical protein
VSATDFIQGPEVGLGIELDPKEEHYKITSQPIEETRFC